MTYEFRSLLNEITKLGHKCGAEQILLFGSRARGDHRERSDIDIAVFGLNADQHNCFREGIEELPTLLDFDVVFVNTDTDPALLENIRKDGIELMGKMDEKYSKLILATDRLSEGVDEYMQNRSTTVRDGVIQRFEFCTELSWKTVREYLIDQGYSELNSPKVVMKQAYADGLISDGDMWVALLNDRNLTSHIYDENTAAAVFGKIATVYLPMFRSLVSALGS